jgi:hypothetical protein
MIGYFIAILFKSPGAAEARPGVRLMIMAAASMSVPLPIMVNRRKPFNLLALSFLCMG